MATKPQLILNLAKELKHSFKNVDLNQIDSKFVKSYVYSCDNTGNITGIAIAGDLKKIPTTIVGTSHALSLCEYLTHLNLSNNKIRDISSLGELKNIQTLRLSENQISDISSLKKLKNIQELVLSSNQINDISPLRELKNIKTLDLCKNQINDISPLKELKNIIELDLRHNKIKQLSEWILHFAKVDSIMYNSNFSNCIHITNNPIENVPIEIIKQGKQAIKAYFEEQKKSKSIPNTCVKMVITGNSSVGKTSFINFLTKHTFKQGEITTHGINQTTWKPENTNLDINIWDFGGQEYYHSTHQLFFSNNALYLLMFDKEHNGNGWIESEICYSEKLKVIEKLEHFDYFYWLRNIRNLTDQSKILMLQNKVDNVDDEEYPDKECFNSNNEYRADKPFKAISISNEYKYFEANQKISNNFVKLQELIISKLNEVKQGEIFEYYLKAKELIETASQTKPVVSIYEFIQICKPAHDEIDKRIVNEETGEELAYRWELLCKYFHETGVLLYYPNSPTLKDKIFIRPTFVTDTIYKILNYKVKQAFGRFTFDDAVQSLDNDTVLAQDIIELMSAPNFKLIFNYPQGSENYIAPQYLDDKKPDERFFTHLTKNMEIGFSLKFANFLPKYILTEFMVNYGRFQKDDIIWKYGIVFEKYSTTAFVEILFDVRKIIYKSDKSGEFERLKYEVFETLRNINKYDKNLKIALFDDQKPYELELALSDARNTQFDLFRLGYEEYKKTEHLRYQTIINGNHIKVEGNGNIVLQDVNGSTININVNNLSEIQEKLSKEHSQIFDLLKEINQSISKIPTFDLREYIMEMFEKLHARHDQHDAAHEAQEKLLKELTVIQAETIWTEISAIFIEFEKTMDEKLLEQVKQIKSSSSLKSKLEMSVPFIQLLGINYKTEFDVVGWAKKMYEKHELKIFKLFGAI